MQPRLLDYLSILKNKRGLQPAIRPLRTLLRILSPRSMKLLMQWSLPHPLPDLSPRRHSPHLSVMRAVLGAVLSRILLLCVGIHAIERVPFFPLMLLLCYDYNGLTLRNLFGHQLCSLLCRSVDIETHPLCNCLSQ
jgi:hypothetical protein